MRNRTPKNPRPQGARKFSQDSRIRHSDANEEFSPIRHGYFKSFDGTRLFYSIEGEGIPLIFCYGLVCSSLHWTYQIQHFRQNYQSIWFDYRGHQNSDMPANLNSLTIDNISKDILALFDDLKIDKAVLLGHSMGVNTVLEFYHQNPHRVAGMVLANGTSKSPLETMFRMNGLQATFKFLKMIYDGSPKLMEMIWKLQKVNPLSQTLVTLSGFNPHLTAAEDIDAYVQQVMDMDPGILLYLIENYETYDATPWLHTVDVPTLIVAGEKDYVIPVEQQELLHQLIPHSQLEVVRRGSHCPQMDLPEYVNLRIEKFLKEINYTNKANLLDPLANPSKESTEKPQVLSAPSVS
jgi:pimeloyl-ACP methyl ester carboxylesterase